MTWTRTPVAAALVDVLSAATSGTVTVFAKPPTTINPPAVIVARPTNVNYATASFARDEATLPVEICGSFDGDDTVDALRDQIRKAIDANPTLEGTVASCTVTAERNWRNVTVAGVELLAAQIVLTILM